MSQEPNTSQESFYPDLPPVEAIAQIEDQQPPVRWVELITVVLLIVLCDLTIYRGEGFAGYAALFVAAPALLLLGYFRPYLGRGTWLVGMMMLALAARLVWCGSGLQIAIGFALLVAFAMALAGRVPHVISGSVFASQTIRAGYEGLIHYGRRMGGVGTPQVSARWLNFVLPLVAFLMFSTIFVVANPDVLGYVSERAEQILINVREWLLRFSLTEVLLWVCVLWIGVGLLRPAASRMLLDERRDRISAGAGQTGAQSPLYSAYRNTLVTVIALFAAYLVFEFQTLWFQEFKEDFYYAGYAHEGAAWLTLALALATAILSLVFSRRTLGDPRLPRLRGLAWIWSLENFLLALAVYNRLFIYIGFNGMTRMRTIGIFGMSTVAIGFALVVWKITRNRNFVWLIRRHLWTLALAIYLYALTPVDSLVVRHNVRQILSGDPKPSVQMLVQPMSAEGVIFLPPLLESSDATIREGIRAMLAQFDDEAEALASRRARQGWTSLQFSDNLALERLRGRAEWSAYTKRENRKATIDAFRKYAYQWY